MIQPAVWSMRIMNRWKNRLEAWFHLIVSCHVLSVTELQLTKVLVWRGIKDTQYLKSWVINFATEFWNFAHIIHLVFIIGFPAIWQMQIEKVQRGWMWTYLYSNGTFVLILEVFAFSSSFNKIAVGEDDRCLHVALPVVAFLQMLTQPVTTRTVSSTHAIFGSD